MKTGDLPAVNAALNALATLLLVAGYVLIKRGQETLHKRVMLSAFGASAAFLACYLVYHFQVGSVRFQGPPPVRLVYLAILVSHVVLAAAVPPLALRTIYLGLRDRRQAHRRLARWTWPIWLYVSVTGVVIYVMLYHLYPPAEERRIIGPVSPPVCSGENGLMPRREIIAGCLAWGVLLASLAPAAACPTCKAALASHDAAGGDIVGGFMWSIIFMMAMPFVILGSLATLFYFQVRRARASQPLPPPREPSGPPAPGETRAPAAV